MYKIGSDEYEQDKQLALAKWFADGCPFEEDEEVLEFKKAQEAREARERENGASITHPGSTGIGRSDSISSTGHVDGNTFYTQNWSTYISRKASSLNTSAGRTKATYFCKDNKYRGRDFKPNKLFGPVEVLKRDDRRSKPIKSIERIHWQK
ncbi:uncharacterized protein OCT59_011221 [Rhizophagus irregularis]|uniref:Uncharacterized protein n=1 Tax=Rhizophagus irregularis (strain DAOM 197198w) TaxID=1432141 RepID=A0A015KY08_RHIIW|nr:hypothetical protein RirG_069240 [Rhizophagus irregularis DAOM 197198w]UZO19959.1 hypothetical protein OCT59_011221 [Rhizophagus irregularis]GBC23633.1 hypothetical protein GLOIN_2v1473325 [Rhizophagus irregularis DAOM 181602=DAOM 197198]CAB5182854.1 unnamed protein product [Rhizophagus irregularis]CAG8502726.1 8900_t:CDS:2 [Rhizophagus irregularis]